MAETAIRRAVMALRDAEDYIGREGKQALFQALDALDQFGKQSQQMTVIAQRATELSLRCDFPHALCMVMVECCHRLILCVLVRWPACLCIFIYKYIFLYM